MWVSPSIFLVAPILREVWPALFKILHTHNLHCQLTNDELVFETHEWKCLENEQQFLLQDFASARRWYLCSSRTNLAVSSGSEHLKKVSSFPWGNAFSVETCFLTRLSFVWKHCGRFPVHFLGSEMNLTLNFLSRSDKFVAGLHLLLSLVSTVVKPACPVFVHRPNPIQEGESQCSQLNQKVDVMLRLWKNIGFTTTEVFTSVRKLGP